MKPRNTGYNSALHRKSRQMHKYPLKERTAMKSASIFERRRIKDGLNRRNPFGGILGFIDSLKGKKKEKNNATDVKGAQGKGHQRQEK